MRFEGHFYPIPCARVHGAMGAGSFPLRASAARFAHQNEQRPAVEFSLFDLGGDPAAVGGAVRLTRISPFSCFAAEPVGALQTVRRASFGDHGSSSEGFAHGADQTLGLRLAAGQFADGLQHGAHGRDRHVNGGQALAWINATVGWARSGERRHLATVAGSVLLLTLGVTLAAGG